MLYVTVQGGLVLYSVILLLIIMNIHRAVELIVLNVSLYTDLETRTIYALPAVIPLTHHHHDLQPASMLNVHCRCVCLHIHGHGHPYLPYAHKNM
jgi:hypothetical protein